MPGLLSIGLGARNPGRIRPSLDGLKTALDAIGNPQHTFRSILVVGTNGKGSTAVMLERVVAATGLNTGLYTSPHLVDPSERLRSGGIDIPARDLDDLVQLFDPWPDLTYFEVLTAAAFVYFSRQHVDLAVLEAGMGGRWDATRLAASSIAGLTNVGSDHPRWLGSSRAHIASDKGAALSAATIAVLGPGVDDAVLPHLGAPLARPAASLVSLEPDPAPPAVRVRWGAHPCTRVLCPLAGTHQIDNLHLALALAVAAEEHGWLPRLHPALLQHALDDVRWPGRCSPATVIGRSVLLDGAHNVESVMALAEYLRSRQETHNLVFSCLDDKPLEIMASLLRPVVGEIVVCELDDARAMPVQRLREAFPEALVGENAVHALGLVGDPVVATGSLRLLGALLRGGE